MVFTVQEDSVMKGLVLAGIFVLLSGLQALAAEAVDETMPAKKFLEPWKEQPKWPRGWQEISRAEGRLATKAGGKDIFVLAMDDRNLMLFWFRKGKTYWDMIVLASDHLDGYRKAKVDPKRLNVVVKEGAVMYGLEETEAIAAYEWDEGKQAFIGFR